MREVFLNDNQLEDLVDISYEFPYRTMQYSYDEYVNKTVIWHWHEEIEFARILKGKIKLYTENNTYDVNEGDIYFVNSEVLSMKTSVSSEAAYEAFYQFHPTLLSGHFHSIYETKYLKPVIMNSHMDVAIFKKDTEGCRRLTKLLNELDSAINSEYHEFKIRNILTEVWIFLLEATKRKPVSVPKDGLSSKERFQYMLAFIHKNYAEKIDLQDIADSANISIREATRCFKKVRDKSPIDYLIEFRLVKAKKMLIETETNITDIALQTGFSDSSYFGKMFKRYLGITPSEFRKKGKA